MKILQPIILKPRYYEEIEKEIIAIFNREIYGPLFAEVNSHMAFADLELKNAKDPLADSIRKGTVDYDGFGNFVGEFNAAISKQLKALGGKFNGLTKTWTVPKLSIPPSVSFAHADATLRFQNLRKGLLKTLDDSRIESLFLHARIRDKYEQAIKWMEGDFDRTVQQVAIPPRVNAAMRANLAHDWTNNLNLHIRGWAQDNIVRLRGAVQQNAFGGHRAQNMVKMIQSNYGVALSKAKFLARQETALLMSKFREQRYKDIGITRYKWSTSHDARVRDDHKDLDGKIISWSSKPVVDKKTGRRAHAGEDFNCRCIARPVWDGS